MSLVPFGLGCSIALERGFDLLAVAFADGAGDGGGLDAWSGSGYLHHLGWLLGAVGVAIGGAVWLGCLGLLAATQEGASPCHEVL